MRRKKRNRRMKNVSINRGSKNNKSTILRLQ